MAIAHVTGISSHAQCTQAGNRYNCLHKAAHNVNKEVLRNEVIKRTNLQTSIEEVCSFKIERTASSNTTLAIASQLFANSCTKLYVSWHHYASSLYYIVYEMQSVCTLHHKGSLTLLSSLSISCLLLLLDSSNCICSLSCSTEFCR